MQKIMVLIFTSVGSWLGWFIGDLVGLMTAFMLSMVGAGLGLYFGKRLMQP